MRLFVLGLILAVAADGLCAGEQLRPASPDEIVLFKDAMKNSSQDTEHWAYTETTTIRASKGGSPGETVVRFDPSKPFAEQYTPLQIDGKPPTDNQRKNYREKGEQRGENHARAAVATPLAGSEPPQVGINGSKMTLDLEHPLVVQDEAERIIFEVPLLGSRKGIPVHKFQIRVQVGKKARQMEKVWLRLREAFRVKLVAKVRAGEASLEFTPVDPAFGPVITGITGNIGASILFFPVNAAFTNTRTEWKRVKAYDERFTVKLAPMQFLDF